MYEKQLHQLIWRKKTLRLFDVLSLDALTIGYSKELMYPPPRIQSGGGGVHVAIVYNNYLGDYSFISTRK